MSKAHFKKNSLTLKRAEQLKEERLPWRRSRRREDEIEQPQLDSLAKMSFGSFFCFLSHSHCQTLQLLDHDVVIVSHVVGFVCTTEK